MHEQRLTVRLTDYWNLLRKEAPIPLFAQFNPGAVGDLWPYCLLFQAMPSVAGAAQKFRVEHVGEGLLPLFGHDLVGREVSKLSLRLLGGGKLAGRVEEVAQSRLPAEDEGKFVNDKNKIVKYRACLLPFAVGPEGLSHIVVGFSWREF